MTAERAKRGGKIRTTASSSSSGGSARFSSRAVLVGASAAQASISLVAWGLPAIGPELMAAYDLTLPELGGVLAAFVVGSGIGMIPAGVAADRYGSQRTMAAGGIVAVTGLVSAALAPSIVVLVLALSIAGVGAAVVPVAGVRPLLRVYGQARRGWALGVRQMAVPLGGMIAAVGLPVLHALGGVRLTLLSTAAAVGVASAYFTVVAGDEPSRRPSVRLEPMRVWRAPGMQRLLLVSAFYVVVTQAVLAYTVPSARAAGFSAFAAGGLFFAVMATACVARIAWGRIADGEGGTRRVRALVFAGSVAAGGAILFAAGLHGGVVTAVSTVVFFAFGALGWNALVYVSACEATPIELAGQSFALAATLVCLVAATSTPPLGALAASAGWDVFWVATAVAAAAGVLVARTLPPAAPREPSPSRRAFLTDV